MLKRKTCEWAEFKLDEDGSGSFSGYASTWGNVDRANEAVVKGAFTKTLERFKSDGFIAVGHDWDGLPVATISEAREDGKGLFIKCDFHSTPAAQAARTVVRERLERGKSVGLSIGYRVKADEPGEKGERLLTEIELYEVSIVTVPCNPEANATGAKGEHFHDGVTANASLAAVMSLMDALVYGPAMSLLYDTGTPREERLAAFDGALAEWSGMVRRFVAAAMEGQAEDAEKAVEQIRALYPRETQHSGSLASGGTGSKAEVAVAAIEAAIEEQERHQAARAAEGRSLSETDTERLKTIRDALAQYADRLRAIEAASVKKATPEQVRQAQINFALSRARQLGVPVL